MARKLEDALGGVLPAGRMPQVHPRYIRALTCTYTAFRIAARAGGGARTGRTRAGRPGNAGTPGPTAVTPTRRPLGAGRWRDPDEGLPKDFEERRSEHYPSLRKPLPR